MSLLEESMEDYVIINNIPVVDDEGGFSRTWVEGVTISGSMVFDSSMQARTAQAQGVSSVYTFITKRDVVLKYHEVLKRKSDNKIFRVTSDGDDKYTPKSAGLNMRVVTCEEWALTKEGSND